MEDRQSLYPGRVELTDVLTGEKRKYDLKMADMPTVAGTPPTKANLLTDQTAELLGLPSTATVNDALAILSNAALVGEDGGLVTAGGDEVSQLKVESGTYTGTGANTASLTFSAKPEFVIISGDAHGSYEASICVPYGSTGIFDGRTLSINFSWNSNTISWTFGNNDPGYGLNVKGKTYNYAAVTK